MNLDFGNCLAVVFKHRLVDFAEICSVHPSCKEPDNDFFLKGGNKRECTVKAVEECLTVCLHQNIFQLSVHCLLRLCPNLVNLE